MSDRIVVTIPLSSPIYQAGQPIHELAIREPTAGDIFRAGNPVKIKSFDPFDFEMDDAKMLNMLSRLTGIEIMGGLEKMSANDSLQAFWAITPFFIPGLSPKQDEQPAS